MVVRARAFGQPEQSVRITTPAAPTANLADLVGAEPPSGQPFGRAVYDALKGLITAGANVVVSTDDQAGTITLAATGELAGGGGGADGVGIASMAYDAETGVWTATMTDSTVYQSGDLRGPQGAQGAPGPAGPQGVKGDVGPAGPQGDAGPQGLQGAQGPAGPQGDVGPQGPQGIQGPAGAGGAAGGDGASAFDIAVASGFVGTEAEWLASLIGPAGADGAPGADGQDGAPGADGADGQSVTITVAADQAAFDAATPGTHELVVLYA
jgi:hypothetical protein